MFGTGFNPQKLKPQLKMAVGRIEILKNKKSALLKQSMRQVAVLLAEDPPKEEKARIRAEALIRDDNLIEALEIIQLECEMLHERIKLLEYSKECPPDLQSVISTVMWASHRVDVPELLLIRKQFKAKYGAQFEQNAMSNIGGCLNERVVTKLSVQPPAAYLVHVYLEKICEQFDVEWKPMIRMTANDMIVPIQPPTGISVPIGTGTGLGPKLGDHDNMAARTGMSTTNVMTNHDYPGMPTVTTTTVPYNDHNNNNNNGGTHITSPSNMSSITSATSDFPTAPSGGAGGGRSIPPPPPQYNNHNNQHHHQQQHHQNSVLPPPANNNFNEEPDIFIPPSAPQSSIAPSTTTKSDNNNDNNNQPMPPPLPPADGGGGGGLTSSYDTLSARFNQLKK